MGLVGRLESSSIDHIGRCAGPITVHALAEEANVSLSQSQYNYPSLQHYLNVCYKDCAKMHCAMCDVRYDLPCRAVFKIHIEVAVREPV